MFTGIIQTTGRVEAVERCSGDIRLRVVAPGLADAGIARGDSVSVSGCCLTVAALDHEALAFDVSNESLARTTLGDLRRGDAVNLEPALRLSERLGGHLVSGHVDGIGTIAGIEPDARSQRWTIEAPAMLMRYFAVKGSVAVDGVSLTLNAVTTTTFEVNLIPHTVAATSFHGRQVGARVNLEVDLVARYLECLLATARQSPRAEQADERAASAGGDGSAGGHE